mmetsp:Transcript_25052/g.63774  ORF Transcript_25052/g.63774 Transcript_25052/m.63774 type:complete len:378 (+) Transcript_25052:309-1442(+)
MEEAPEVDTEADKKPASGDAADGKEGAEGGGGEGEAPGKRKREDKDKGKEKASKAKAGAREKEESLERKLLKTTFTDAKPFIRYDRERVAAITQREVTVRTRTSVLVAPSTDKFSVLNTLLEQFKHKNKRMLEEKEKAKQPHKQPRPSGSSSISKPMPSSRPSASVGAVRGSSSSAPTPAHLARSASSSSAASAAKPGSFKGLRPGVAILIVPSAITSIVSMLNVQALLESNEFASGAERKAAGAVKEVSFSLTHKFEDGSKVELLVIDNPAKLAPSEWGQVVGCIAQGSTWQFKGWPFPQGEVDIFAKMAGFYIRFNDEIPNQKTKGWTVTNLVFSREKSRKHEVGVMMSNFWMTLHKFMQVHKPHLLHSARSSRI